MKKTPGVIAVSETKINKQHTPLFQTKICGYNFAHADSDQKASGVGIYTKDNLSFESRIDICLDLKDLKACGLKLIFVAGKVFLGYL